MKNYNIVRELMPRWNETETRITELTGGLVNRTYLVETGEDAMTVRFPGKHTRLYVDRQIEKNNVQLLAEGGIAPRIVEFHDDGTMIRSFIRGTVATKESFKDPDVRRHVIKAIKQLHESNVRLHNRFNVFEKIRDYDQLLDVCSDKMPEGLANNRISVMVNRIERVLAARGTVIVPCHNDLLPGNFVLTRDRARMIDWEYAGMNDARYDIANHIAELDNLTQDEENHIMTLYFGEQAHREQETVDLYKLPSRFLWALWACIQCNISELDFDFKKYARHQLDRCSEYMEMLNKKYASIINNQL